MNIIINVNGFPLGDELSINRNLIIDLIVTKSINLNNLFIYTCNDRKFLYDKFINNIIICEEKKLHDNDFLNFKIYNATDIILFPSVNWNIFGSYKNSLSKIITNPMIPLLNNYQRINYFANEKKPEFKQIATNINFLNLDYDFLNNFFILIHHRRKNDGAWDQDIDSLNILINKLIDKYHIVIFTNDNIHNKVNKQTFIINNLHEYASLMHHHNCKALISVWSGGGQIGQYFCNSKVIQYFHPCQIQHNEFDENGKLYNCWLDSSNAFDFTTFSNCERFFFKNFKTMVDNLDSIL